MCIHLLFLSCLGVHRAVMEERRRLEEEFAQMESHLNDARREQTKMAVALKQCQRTAAVEREQLLASVELEREHLHQELEQNKAKLGSVLAERNLMIVRIFDLLNGPRTDMCSNPIRMLSGQIEGCISATLIRTGTVQKRARLVVLQVLWRKRASLNNRATPPPPPPPPPPLIIRM